MLARNLPLLESFHVTTFTFHLISQHGPQHARGVPSSALKCEFSDGFSVFLACGVWVAYLVRLTRCFTVCNSVLAVAEVHAGDEIALTSLI